jgi:hypothetical protein
MKKTKAALKSDAAAPAPVPAPAPTDAIGEDLHWNEEINEDVSAEGESEIVVYSRDWTIWPCPDVRGNCVA